MLRGSVDGRLSIVATIDDGMRDARCGDGGSGGGSGSFDCRGGKAGTGTDKLLFV